MSGPEGRPPSDPRAAAVRGHSPAPDLDQLLATPEPPDLLQRLLLDQLRRLLSPGHSASCKAPPRRLAGRGWVASYFFRNPQVRSYLAAADEAPGTSP